uniref:Uncharacterized protein n=1 Tax=Bosea sp. NBC_00436 TaxID=2969620 RepID=A0A9E7ZWH1_9HYPH
MNPASTSPQNLIGLYSAWRLDDEALGDPTERAPDFHVEMRLARFHIEPSALLKSSARMARREAFPLDGIEAEELGTHFVDDAIAAYIDSLYEWLDLPPTGDLTFAKRMDNRFETLGRTRFVTEPADLAATLKRHGLPEGWAADRGSEAWAPAPHRGPSFEEFAERLRAFDREHRAQEAKRNRRRGGFEL